MSGTEITPPTFPFSKILPHHKYARAPFPSHGSGTSPLTRQWLESSYWLFGHTVLTCAVHSRGSCIFHSFLLKNIPIHMLASYLFSSNLDALVLFHGYISCSIAVSFHLFWSFQCKTNRNITFWNYYYPTVLQWNINGKQYSPKLWSIHCPKLHCSRCPELTHFWIERLAGISLYWLHLLL